MVNHKKTMHWSRSLIVSLASLAAITYAEDAPQPKVRFIVTKVADLPGVRGRIDHLAYDDRKESRRLFIAALGNNSVEVVDLLKSDGRNNGQSLPGFDEPQGLSFLADSNQLVVASGGDGSCRIYSGDTLKLQHTIDLKSDADNVHYDAAAKRLYVGHADGAIAVIDPEIAKIIADIKVSAHPEGFAVDSAAKRVYVNVPKSKRVEVIDLEKQTVVEKWKIDGGANYPMALDAAHHRLLVGCRSPAQLNVIDTTTGTVTATIKCAGDIDDIFITDDGERVYAVCGEGKLDVFKVASNDKIELDAEGETSKGARTGLMLKGQIIIVAAPAAGAENAKLLSLDEQIPLAK
jgi:DNA-binding beta-propeller fold protein YncE